MKKAAVLAVVLAAVVLSGCATSSTNKVYSLSASGYSEILDKEEANTKARSNIVESVKRFLEHKLPVDAEMSEKIGLDSYVIKEGTEKNYYYVTLGYDLDLYRFAAGNSDFRRINTWELLGLQNYYSSYIMSRKPLGIWIKDELESGKPSDDYFKAALSIIPVYSGNFLSGRHVAGAFFTGAKSLMLITAVLSPANEIEMRTMGWVGLGVLTVLDAASVIFTSGESRERLTLLQEAVLSGSGDINIEFKKKF